MATFVLGAGATVGASFVNFKTNPVMPPLDTDFFTQLQRVSSPKHQQMIRELIKGVVGLFGVNFNATLEETFATVDDAIKLFDSTGNSSSGRGHYSKKDMQAIGDNLLKGISAVMEESMTEGLGAAMKSKACEYHEKLVKSVIDKRDTILSFNYDCLMDDTLKYHGNGKWNSHYGYALPIGPGSKFLTNDHYWQCSTPALKDDTIKYLKLHGSMNYRVKHKKTGDSEVVFKQYPYTTLRGYPKYTIIPPVSNKKYDVEPYISVWKQASKSLAHTKCLVFIGYSFPATDYHATALFRVSLKKESLKSLVIVNPDKEARKRTRNILRRALSGETKVFSFNSLEEFSRINKSIWNI